MAQDGDETDFVEIIDSVSEKDKLERLHSFLVVRQR